jgi:SecD/SecF fusion protein
MFIGVIVGTYSSLFIAAPIVVDAMQKRLEKDGDAMKLVTAVDVKK